MYARRWVGQAEPQSGNRSPVFGNYESIKAGDVHSKTAKVKTLWESFNNSCQVYSSKNFLGA